MLEVPENNTFEMCICCSPARTGFTSNPVALRIVLDAVHSLFATFFQEPRQHVLGGGGSLRRVFPGGCYSVFPEFLAAHFPVFFTGFPQSLSRGPWGIFPSVHVTCFRKSLRHVSDGMSLQYVSGGVYATFSRRSSEQRVKVMAWNVDPLSFVVEFLFVLF